MPDSEPWTQGEIVRAVRSFGETLHRIEEKLDTRPSWDDVNRITNAQSRTDTKQDEAIKALQDRAMQLLLLGIGSGLSGITAIVVGVATR